VSVGCSPARAALDPARLPFESRFRRYSEGSRRRRVRGKRLRSPAHDRLLRHEAVIAGSFRAAPSSPARRRNTFPPPHRGAGEEISGNEEQFVLFPLRRTDEKACVLGPGSNFRKERRTDLRWAACVFLSPIRVYFLFYLFISKDGHVLKLRPVPPSAVVNRRGAIRAIRRFAGMQGRGGTRRFRGGKQRPFC